MRRRCRRRQGHAGVALLLASEGRSRVLRVEPDGATAWITPALEELGRPLGMLRLDNAGLEGIARLPNGRILVAAERDLRGLIELPAGGLRDEHDRAAAQAWAMPSSICTPPPGRRTTSPISRSGTARSSRSSATATS